MKPERNYYEATHLHHYIPIQIRFDNIDEMGHVNNNILLSYFDYGKVHYLTSVNSRLSETERVEVVIVHYEVDFYKPVLLHDHFYVEIAFAGCGTKSKLKCICKTIMSGLNKQTGNAEILTDGFKQEMERFENKNLKITHFLKYTGR